MNSPFMQHFQTALPRRGFLTVTFNQPMVALGTLDQLDDEDVPVRVSPEVKGRWRWADEGDRLFRGGRAAAAGGSRARGVLQPYRISAGATSEASAD